MNSEFFQFFQLSLDLLCIAGKDGYFKKLNAAWERCLGFSLEELISRPFVEFVHPEDQQRTLAETSQLNSGIQTVGFTNRYQTKAKGYRWLAWSASNVNGVIYAVARDITDEIQARQTNLEQQQQIQSIAANVPGMLFRLHWSPTTGYSCSYASVPAITIFEIENSHFMRCPNALQEFIIAEDRPSFQAVLDDTRLHLGPLLWEGRIRTASGALKWVRNTSTPHRLTDGAVLWDGLIVDITRDKELGALVLDQQVKMVNSSKLASLGEMAGGVAHEINNTLAILKGYASQVKTLLEQQPTDLCRIGNALDRIDVTVDRLARIVNSLGRMARNSPLDPPSAQSVAELIAETLLLCTERFRGHGIDLIVSQIPSEWTLDCRPVEFSHALLNLLNNAYDAVELAAEKWIRLEVNQQGPNLEISVTDSGPGITAPLRNRIMVPFFTTKPLGRGTGLGLSIAKSIVEAHGGSLTLDAESLQTRFVISLPS